MGRELSPEFLKAFQGGGLLNPLLINVQEDISLDFQIRKEDVHIYYRGGRILGIEPKNKNNYKIFLFSFDKGYFKNDLKTINDLELPYEIESLSGVEKWISNLPFLKKGMDHFLVNNERLEREFQQLIIRENNYSRISNATDYFIADTEYRTPKVNGKTAKFDLIGIKWKSDGEIRQRPRDTRLVIFEVKYYDKALDRTSGIIDHIKDVDAFLNSFKDDKNIEIMEMEILKIFQQKRDLDLVRFGEDNNLNKVENISIKKPEFILIIINHDPHSKTLNSIFSNLPPMHSAEIKIAAANFMGYGLWEECIYTLDGFKEKFSTQIYSEKK